MIVGTHGALSLGTAFCEAEANATIALVLSKPPNRPTARAEVAKRQDAMLQQDRDTRSGIPLKVPWEHWVSGVPKYPCLYSVIKWKPPETSSTSTWPFVPQGLLGGNAHGPLNG